MRLIRVRSATFVVCFGIFVLMGEFGLLYIYSCNWDFPQRSRGVGSDVVKILLVSDPQIQGYRNENHLLGWITRWDADNYLRRSFAAACDHVQPEIVVFLGDLLDEGSIATEAEFRQYSERFRRIFDVPSGATAVYLPGDNDIGGEGAELMTWEKIGRFSEAFGKPNLVINLKDIDFVKVNTVIWLRGGAALNQDETNFLQEFSLFLGVVEEDRRSFHAPVVLSHVPMSLSNQAREKIFNELRPRVVFSGHTHKAGEQKFELEEEKNVAHYKEKEEGPLDVTDYTVPTCSYRMGVSQMGYGAALLGSDGKAQLYTVLWLPPRYPVLFAYLGIIVICIAVYCFYRLKQYRK